MIAALREQVSLLLANGHPNAGNYPLPRLKIEAEIVAKRRNRELAQEAMLTQTVIASVLSDKGAKSFKEDILRLTKD